MLEATGTSRSSSTPPASSASAGPDTMNGSMPDAAPSEPVPDVDAAPPYRVSCQIPSAATTSSARSAPEPFSPPRRDRPIDVCASTNVRLAPRSVGTIDTTAQTSAVVTDTAHSGASGPASKLRPDARTAGASPATRSSGPASSGPNTAAGSTVSSPSARLMPASCRIPTPRVRSSATSVRRWSASSRATSSQA